MRQFLHNLLKDGGPSSSRLINLGCFLGLTVAMLKMTWRMDNIATDANLWYWASFTTYAVYGMGVATFNKWLDIVKLKVGGNEAAKQATE